MAGRLPVRLIKENIDSQVQASQQIFAVIDRLAQLATNSKDENVTAELAEVMKSLLDVGKKLSENASKTGNEVLKIVGVVSEPVS
jgi:hypothetical protein